MTFEDSAELQFKKPALCLWPLASPFTNKFTLVSHCYLERSVGYECFPSNFSQINLPHVIFIFFLSKHFSYFCCASCNEILNSSVRMLNILWWESYTIKLICKGWHFYSFSDKFYHWCSVYIQTRARVSILVWPRALWLSTQTWLLVLVWYNKGWIGSVGRIQQKYYIEISGGQFIPEAVVLFFSGLALVCYQLNSHN